MTLEEIRLQIDQVDRSIKDLFIRRMQLAEQVALEKAKTEDEIYKPDRESAIIERQSADMDEHLIMEYKALIKRMMELSRKYQYGRTLQLRDCFPFQIQEEEPEITRIGVLREEYYLAGPPFNAANPDKLISVRTMRELGEKVASGELDAGLGIIERIGSGVDDELNSLLLDCSLFINYCRVIREETGKQKVVTFTRRFVVKEEHNRLKLVFVTPNRSGALGSILSMIADYGVNLTEIHSIPFWDTPGGGSDTDWNYRFFLELEANLLREEVRALIFQLSCETEWMQLLGSYRCLGDFRETE